MGYKKQNEAIALINLYIKSTSQKSCVGIYSGNHLLIQLNQQYTIAIAINTDDTIIHFCYLKFYFSFAPFYKLVSSQNFYDNIHSDT